MDRNESLSAAPHVPDRRMTRKRSAEHSRRASERAIRSWQKGPVLVRLRFPDVGEEPRVRSAALGIERTSLVQAELAVDREPYLGGIVVFLPVIFPPAHRAQRHRAGRFECFISTARATKASLYRVHCLDGRAFWGVR